MKTKIVTAALALMTLSVNAFAFGNEKPSALKNVPVEGKFQKIAVGTNIKVVLVPANEHNSIQVAGNENKVNGITVTVNNNTMVIASKKSLSAGNVTVYVPAADLSYIDLGKGASLSGEGPLKFKDLTVLLNVDCWLDLKMLGKLNVKQTEDCELVYVKNEKRKVYVKQ